MELRSIEKALKSYPRPAHIQFTKLLFHLNQTNYWNNRFYGTTAACPCCNKAMEMFSHITTCPTKLATSSRLVSLLALQSDLDEIFTPKALSKLVLDKLSGKPVESSSLFSQPNTKLAGSTSWLAIFQPNGNLIIQSYTLHPSTLNRHCGQQSLCPEYGSTPFPKGTTGIRWSTAKISWKKNPLNNKNVQR